MLRRSLREMQRLIVLQSQYHGMRDIVFLHRLILLPVLHLIEKTILIGDPDLRLTTGVCPDHQLPIPDKYLFDHMGPLCHGGLGQPVPHFVKKGRPHRYQEDSGSHQPSENGNTNPGLLSQHRHTEYGQHNQRCPETDKAGKGEGEIEGYQRDHHSQRCHGLQPDPFRPDHQSCHHRQHESSIGADIVRIIESRIHHSLFKVQTHLHLQYRSFQRSEDGVHPAAFHIVISRRLKCSQDAYDKSSQGKGSQEDINLLLMVQKSIGEEEDYGIGKENHESFPLLIASPQRHIPVPGQYRGQHS